MSTDEKNAKGIIKSVSVDFFRGIRHCEFNDLGMINVLVWTEQLREIIRAGSDLLFPASSFR